MGLYFSVKFVAIIFPIYLLNGERYSFIVCECMSVFVSVGTCIATGELTREKKKTSEHSKCGFHRFCCQERINSMLIIHYLGLSSWFANAFGLSQFFVEIFAQNFQAVKVSIGSSPDN